jgi:CRISPR-associated protein Cas2
MRRNYLVCYDIRDPKRLRKVHRLMKAYGEGWQYSVFYCTLRAIDRVRLENGLRELIHFKEDQVLLVDLGMEDGGIRDLTVFMGVGVPEAETGVLVI